MIAWLPANAAPQNGVQTYSAKGVHNTGGAQLAKPSSSGVVPMNGTGTAANSFNAKALPLRIHIDAPEPTPKELATWTDLQLGAYLISGEWATRMTRTAEMVAEAQKNLSRAQSVLKSIIPASKSYGEPEGDYARRHLNAENEYRRLIQPYESDYAVAKERRSDAVIIHEQYELRLPTGSRINSD
jgi:hypothetical protein